MYCLKNHFFTCFNGWANCILIADEKGHLDGNKSFHVENNMYLFSICVRFFTKSLKTGSKYMIEIYFYCFFFNVFKIKKLANWPKSLRLSHNPTNICSSTWSSMDLVIHLRPTKEGCDTASSIIWTKNTKNFEHIFWGRVEHIFFS